MLRRSSVPGRTTTRYYFYTSTNERKGIKRNTLVSCHIDHKSLWKLFFLTNNTPNIDTLYKCQMQLVTIFYGNQVLKMGKRWHRNVAVRIAKNEIGMYDIVWHHAVKIGVTRNKSEVLGHFPSNASPLWEVHFFVFDHTKLPKQKVPTLRYLKISDSSVGSRQVHDWYWRICEIEQLNWRYGQRFTKRCFVLVLCSYLAENVSHWDWWHCIQSWQSLTSSHTNNRFLCFSFFFILSSKKL